MLRTVLCCCGVQIAKIDIDYAKVAKRIDVKRLKSTMWEVISEAVSASAFSPAAAKNVSSPSASVLLFFCADSPYKDRIIIYRQTNIQLHQRAWVDNVRHCKNWHWLCDNIITNQLHFFVQLQVAVRFSITRPSTTRILCTYSSSRPYQTNIQKNSYKCQNIILSFCWGITYLILLTMECSLLVITTCWSGKIFLTYWYQTGLSCLPWYLLFGIGK